MTNLLCEVAVIGAGLAGLASADYLKSHGYDVKVIEAESRVGGRVLTYHLPDNTHFELGPFSFGNGEQPLWDYVHRFALPIIKHTQIERIFWFKDWTGKISEKGPFLEGQEQEIPLYLLLNAFRKKLEEISEDMPLYDALRLVGASENAIEWLQANTLIGLLGNGFKTNSTHAVLTFLKQYDDSTSFYAIKGGNDQLPQAFANQLKENIIFNHRVQKIEQLKEKCILKGETFTIEAKRVIFAIPLSEMKKIEINPSLSLEKQSAIQNIAYTLCARISIIAPSAIFGVPPRAGVFLFSDSLGWFREQTLFQIDPYKKTVLNISVVGHQAEKLSLSESGWKKSVDEALSKLYPNWDPEKAEYHTHVWKEGYSYFSATMSELQNSLKKVEGRIHFAGEHTSDKFSSMNGALESGIRVAKEIQGYEEI
ncbi:NAD(P)/FAD-dependent oxidoreductase [Parachlamydia sp. AcF125]|uniref:flavin monoamine oxidase family protein n=1 Tax=Parachlamydia sp. AcF125 TaxID=2795736 RepID=UPI001BCA57CB|nr:NAD(P)/FAD-dependent oxidoreductase [Parachlamydia sp. AcF125]MBS4168979.1 Flavin-dependent L-tryptophan oxidase RebO [Parachlamydia sp. AcF125]